MFGRVELRGLREKVGAFAAGFDPALVSPAQANAMVDDAAAIEKMAATVKALLAARVAETEVATREGDKTPAHALARRTGTTVGKAAETIRTGKRLAKQPKLDAAAREGKVSPEQAAAISDATEADPAAVEGLVTQGVALAPASPGRPPDRCLARPPDRCLAGPRLSLVPHRSAGARHRPLASWCASIGTPWCAGG